MKMRIKGKEKEKKPRPNGKGKGNKSLGGQATEEALLAKEIQLCRELAGNSLHRRTKALKALRWWITHRHESKVITLSESERIWKGLFYSVWMSDKPLVQEDLCDDLSTLFRCLNGDLRACGVFYRGFLKVMRDNWFGIDQHRLDKFLMLVRRVTRGFLFVLKDSGWSREIGEVLTDCLTSEGCLLAESPFGGHLGLGLRLHLSEIFMEEVAKVSGGEINSDTLIDLLRPFTLYVCYGDEQRLLKAIIDSVFGYLIRQSELGLDYHDRYLAWKTAGFPGGSVDAMQKVEVDIPADENEEARSDNAKKTAMDPRAGHVDAIVPQIPVDGEKIAKHLDEYVTDKRTTLSNRRKLRALVVLFEKLSRGNYPFKAKSVVLPSDKKFKLPKVAESVKQLEKFLEENKKKHDELEGLNKRQRRKMLMKLKKQQEEEENGTEPEERSTSAPKKIKKTKSNSSLGDWTVEEVNAPAGGSKIDGPNSTCASFTVEDNKDEIISSVHNVRPDTATNGSSTNTNEENEISVSTPSPKKSTNSPKKLEKSMNSSLDLSKTMKKKVKTSTPVIVKKTKKSPWVEDPFVKNDIKQTKTVGETLNKSLPNIKKANLNGKRLNVSESNLSKKADQVMKNIKSLNASSCSTPNNKKVMIQLKNNTSQHVIDYFKSVKQSPDIPYDSSKRPLKTSLKPNSIPSPINPFYKKKLKLSI